jgi:hypothetical protein
MPDRSGCYILIRSYVIMSLYTLLFSIIYLHWYACVVTLIYHCKSMYYDYIFYAIKHAYFIEIFCYFLCCFKYNSYICNVRKR